MVARGGSPEILTDALASFERELHAVPERAPVLDLIEARRRRALGVA